MKIAILGYSGSGKSTLAKYLSGAYGIPLLYLDRVNFQADWQERDTEEARQIVRTFMEQPDWVIDGNYNRFYRQERLEQADRIVLMLFNRFSTLHRIIRRNQEFRNRSRESMADGCAEKLDFEFLYWILLRGRTPSKILDYRRLIREYSGKVTVIRNQRQLDRFMEAESLKSADYKKQKAAANDG